MKMKLVHGLIVLNILVWLLILVIYLFPFNILRIILGIPFLLVFPGYTLVAALFPQKERIGGIERVALSFGLSIAVVPLIGFILNYMPWGIRLEPIMYSVASFILICSIVAWLRQRRLIEDERLAIEFQVTMPSWGEGIRDRVLTVILVIVVLGAMGAIGYFIAAPKIGETFTEFYILGHEDGVLDYPRELKVGEQGRVMIGIINYERNEVSYRVEVFINGEKSIDVGPVVLVDKQKWEGELVFVPKLAGDNQKVEFLLYKDNEVEPYLGPLYVWFDANGQ